VAFLERQRMSPKEQFDSCMKLADFAAGRWDAPRQYEWKLAFGIWAFLGAALTFVEANAFPWFLGFLIVIFYAIWLRGVWLRNEQDGEIAWRATRAADKILELNLVRPKPKSLEPRIKNENYRHFLGFLGNWSMGLQFWFTVTLVVLFYIVKVHETTFWHFAEVTIKK
jgi:hypothetical protein